MARTKRGRVIHHFRDFLLCFPWTYFEDRLQSTFLPSISAENFTECVCLFCRMTFQERKKNRNYCSTILLWITKSSMRMHGSLARCQVYTMQFFCWERLCVLAKFMSARWESIIQHAVNHFYMTSSWFLLVFCNFSEKFICFSSRLEGKR